MALRAGDRAPRYWGRLYLPATTARWSRRICAMLAWAAVHPHLSYWANTASSRASRARRAKHLAEEPLRKDLPIVLELVWASQILSRGWRGFKYFRKNGI
jgi:hypothetical protein